MLNKNMLRRAYIIIRRIMKNDFPTKEMIMKYLIAHGIEHFKIHKLFHNETLQHCKPIE